MKEELEQLKECIKKIEAGNGSITTCNTMITLMKIIRGKIQVRRSLGK